MTSVCDTTINAHELSTFADPAWQAIDVRSATEFASGHIPAAVNIPMDEIECRLADLRPGTRTVLVCQSGMRAGLTRDLLANRVADLFVLGGGTDAWRAAGLPIVASTRSR
ncbi:MAG: rhodanese-like domain-containing protein, partial [Acidobacteriota bacterium]|nr:rhodanese-like domain-containing protein [Acidobacteriota bacterium]